MNKPLTGEWLQIEFQSLMFKVWSLKFPVFLPIVELPLGEKLILNEHQNIKLKHQL